LIDKLKTRRKQNKQQIS